MTLIRIPDTVAGSYCFGGDSLQRNQIFKAWHNARRGGRFDRSAKPYINMRYSNSTAQILRMWHNQPYVDAGRLSGQRIGR